MAVCIESMDKVLLCNRYLSYNARIQSYSRYSGRCVSDFSKVVFPVFPQFSIDVDVYLRMLLKLLQQRADYCEMILLIPGALFNVLASKLSLEEF